MLCRKHRVQTPYLLGSAVTGTFDPAHSGLDFLVKFLPDAGRTGFKDGYFGLRDDLASLLGRPVDFIESGTLGNPCVIATAEQSKAPLYAAARCPGLADGHTSGV